MHMPPPPLNIPQNNNPIPTAMSNDGNQVLSPTGSAGTVRRAAPEPNKRALYIGGLDPRVTEEVLKKIFETTGHVQSVKIIPDKNVSQTHIHITTAPRTLQLPSLHMTSSPSHLTFSSSVSHI